MGRYNDEIHSCSYRRSHLSIGSDYAEKIFGVTDLVETLVSIHSAERVSLFSVFRALLLHPKNISHKQDLPHNDHLRYSSHYELWFSYW